ncbi:hypothetical protein BHM03_00000446 [Ensete ventricosum]|uniref:Uncharacterized protein n=1 Tax=Ensete ventricosum TaxID=4639 RepID=A0A445M8K5_ENSVE|nr:hypothetical protein BHM03_00000446 [Ensete ventricosum]
MHSLEVVPHCLDILSRLQQLILHRLGPSSKFFQLMMSINMVKVRVVLLLLQLPALLFDVIKLSPQVVDLSLEVDGSFLSNSHHLQPSAPLKFSDLAPKASHFLIHNTDDLTRVLLGGASGFSLSRTLRRSSHRGLPSHMRRWLAGSSRSGQCPPLGILEKYDRIAPRVGHHLGRQDLPPLEAHLDHGVEQEPQPRLKGVYQQHECLCIHRGHTPHPPGLDLKELSTTLGEVPEKDEEKDEEEEEDEKDIPTRVGKATEGAREIQED